MMKYKWKGMMQLKIQKIFKTKTELKLIYVKFRLIKSKLVLINYNKVLMKQKKLKTEYFKNKSTAISYKYKILKTLKKISNANKSKF